MTITTQGGIYKIVNKLNGKYYVGRTKNFKKRWYDHRKRLRKNCHINSHLQRAWNKDGEHSFEFVITEIIDVTICHKETEQKYIDQLIEDRKNGIDNSYNISESSDGPTLFGNKNGMFGRKHSNESKNLMSNNRRGKKHTEETKKMWSERRKGKPSWNKGMEMSEEYRKKLSIIRKGRRHSVETKRKISLSQLREKNHRFGKRPTENQINKMVDVIVDKTIYTWKNDKLLRTENMTRRDFYKKYNIPASNICDLIKGKRKSVYGWYIETSSPNGVLV
jgi:group I intron endonuclease